MPADITKIITGNNYNEGGAGWVSVGPVQTLYFVDRDGSNKTWFWNDLIANLATKFQNRLYYCVDPAYLGTTADVVTSGSNADATITYSADPYGYHTISGIAYSYSGTVTTGRITVENGSGTIVFDETIPAAGSGFFDFKDGLAGSPNTAMIIKIFAGGSGVVGKLNVIEHRVI